MHILVVEDHIDSRVALSNLLTRVGHEVAAAGNVREALQLFSHLRFDVLLSDIDLPDGNGLDLMMEVRKHHKVKQAVAITALDGEEDRAKGMRAGFDRYLVKPLDFAELRSLLEAA